MVFMGWFVLVGRRRCKLSGRWGERHMMIMVRSITMIYGVLYVELIAF